VRLLQIGHRCITQSPTQYKSNLNLAGGACVALYVCAMAQWPVQVWYDGLLAWYCRLSVRPSVTLCIVSLRVGVWGWKLYVPSCS